MTQRLIPKLRFPEFSGEWEVKKLGDISKVFSGGTPISSNKSYYSGKIPFIKSGEISAAQTEQNISGIALKASSAKIVESGDILYALYGATSGQVAISRIKGAINQAVLCIRPDAERYFIYSKLSGDKDKILGTYLQGGQGNLSGEIIKQLQIFLPSIEEQGKIAGFLTVIDNRIAEMDKKVELLRLYKKGVMQKIFSQKLRFKDENDQNYPTWQEKNLGESFSRLTRKNIENNTNVLTISAQQGLINQEDFFNKSVAAKNLRGYYILEKGDFAYNKSYSKGYPVGAIKMLKNYDKGVVSTLYICFRTKHAVSKQFFEHYFNAGLLNHEIKKIAQEGARNHGLLNMSITDFFQGITIHIPDSSEQQKIADFLTSLDNKITAEERKLESARQFKKALLQQMFV
jgi:type I restriction enzyme S subunit